MAKFIHRGSAGPDDPIYLGGQQIFNPIPRPAPKPPKGQPENPPPNRRTTMTTALDDIRDSIARLEKTNPESRFLRDLRNQLLAFEDNPEQSAHSLFCSGNPVVPAERTRK